ncbi:hypothetical protein [Okeania sp. SIO1I7]|nr:hypothetical protein [Okeania sp. SIO1I7]
MESVRRKREEGRRKKGEIRRKREEAIGSRVMPKRLSEKSHLLH